MMVMKNERELAAMIMDTDLPKRLEAENAKLRSALQMGLDLGESDKHGDGPSCPTCHFVREARKALGHVTPDANG
jgi:hypothetical protein